jgi:hypothetical protein
MKILASMTSVAFIMMVNQAERVRFSKYFGVESKCVSRATNRFAFEAVIAKKCLHPTCLIASHDPLLPVFQHEDDFIITYRQYSSLCFIAGCSIREVLQTRKYLLLSYFLL